MATLLGFEGDLHSQAVDQFRKLYKVFTEFDTTMVEINPLAVDASQSSERGIVQCFSCRRHYLCCCITRIASPPVGVCVKSDCPPHCMYVVSVYMYVQSNLVSEYTWGPSKLLLTISSTC